MAFQSYPESEVTRPLKLDTTPWYKNSNLRLLYLRLVPAVLGVEMTSGYDSPILNGVQAVQTWLTCMCRRSDSLAKRNCALILTMNRLR